MRATSNFLDRALRPFSKVQAGEGLIAFLMLAGVFLILTSYYVLKTAREGLILASGTFGLPADEVKLYATGAMAVVLIAVVPAYSALANRVRRVRLLNISYSIVVASLFVFFVLGRAGVPVGIPFFIWLGLVSVFLIAQFWSYANDIYSEEQGKRLFAIIAIGGSLGAIAGPKIAKIFDTYLSMMVAAAVLAGCVVLLNIVERLHAQREPQNKTASEPISGAGGFSLVLKDRYLLLIAALLFVTNLVNTTGEFILSSAVTDHAALMVPDTAHAHLVGTARDEAITADRREVIKAFYADFFFWVNLIGFLVQAFLVSRIIKHLGVRKALFALPLVAFAAYGMIGVIGGLAIIRAAKIAENSVDYSLNNTVRQTLFLPTDRAVKYKAKAAIDTFFVRAGDLLAALVVGFGIHQLGFEGRELAFVNLGLVTVSIAIAIGIARRHKKLSPAEPETEAKQETPPSRKPVPAGAHA